MSKDQTYFQEKWLDSKLYKDWIAPVKNDNTQARCTKCKHTFLLSNMGVGAVNSHAKGSGHTKLVKQVHCFFKPTSTKDKSEKKTTDKPSNSLTQQSLELTVQKSLTTKAEIRFLLHSLTTGQSHNSNHCVGKLFQSMFPDSAIAKSFTLGRQKMAYVTSHGLAPYFKEILKDRVITSDSCFVISFDESLNDVTQKSEMDLLIRYWDTVDQEVKVRFWDAKFLGHATHQDLLATFNEATGSLNMSKMIQLSMDGPAVNVKLYDVLKNSRSDNQLPGLIDIGSCGLHVIHGGFQTGAKKTPWDINKTLKATWQILHDSPARLGVIKAVFANINTEMP